MMSSESGVATTLLSDFGQFELRRYPLLANESLQAWDAADEYLLQKLHSEFTEQGTPNGNTLIFNDSFGALGVALQGQNPVVITDSYIAEQGLRANLARNGYAESGVQSQDSLAPLPSAPALVLIKVTKYQALLEQQLIELSRVVTPQTRIIAAGKAKEIHTSTLALFEKWLGETKTSLAWKKARLIEVIPRETATTATSPYPTCWNLEGTSMRIHNHANVFSRTSLDIGARFMLEHLPIHGAKKVIDLGCGNGVLGLSLLARDENVLVNFSDESYMAVASARINVEHNLPDALHRATFSVNNSLDGVAMGAADRILCNPPFHQLQAITDHIAWQMFCDAKRVLPQGGDLWVVGNRHLEYHLKLKRLFDKVQLIAGNNKFVIFRAIKR